MKQKIVIRVQMTNSKCRNQAMTTAASKNGVISVAIEGPDKDQLVVIGEGVDVVNLTSSLQRKRRCWQRKRRCATLLRVEEVKEEVKEAVKPDVPKVEQGSQYPQFPECYQVVYCQDPYYPCFIF